MFFAFWIYIVYLLHILGRYKIFIVKWLQIIIVTLFIRYITYCVFTFIWKTINKKICVISILFYFYIMSKILGWPYFERIIVKKLKTIFFKHICMLWLLLSVQFLKPRFFSYLFLDLSDTVVRGRTAFSIDLSIYLVQGIWHHIYLSEDRSTGLGCTPIHHFVQSLFFPLRLLNIMQTG